ncbi:MAG: large conductance mechanosensitive channel protein MscL [Anaerolineales bacterium]|jgi:large conductance mechanosensitive channel
MLKDFKDFIMRGNVLDLAVAFIIGAAFGKIISSLVTDILMPPIGLIFGKMDFSSLYINLSGTPYSSLAAAQAAGAATINYGMFLNNVINFVIVGLVIFLMVRAANSLQRSKPAASTTKECPYCLSKIPINAVRCAYCTSELKGK